MALTLKTKKKLFDYCQQYVDERIALVKNEMESNQEAANSETKGSAGDKHETGRAMMHLEKEKHARQLAEHIKLKKVLAQINPEEAHQIAGLGSLIKTNSGIYYLSIAVGKVEIGGENYFIISPASPIGNLLINTQVGSELSFNGKKIIVELIK
jgi:hypothetical protein